MNVFENYVSQVEAVKILNGTCPSQLKKSPTFCKIKNHSPVGNAKLFLREDVLNNKEAILSELKIRKEENKEAKIKNMDYVRSLRYNQPIRDENYFLREKLRLLKQIAKLEKEEKTSIQ